MPTDPEAEGVSRRAFLRSVVPRKSALSEEELHRYSHQLDLAQWSEGAQTALRDASVLVVGAGALGSPVLAYLAGAGVGRIGIVDPSEVVVSGLHRQWLHDDLGARKAESAVARLRALNRAVLAESYPASLGPDNAAMLIEGHDLVVECSNSTAASYEANKACCEIGLPLVVAGMRGLAGHVMSVRPGESACYRCAFPELQDDREDAGALGPVAGVLGSLQALEALKLIGGLDGALLDAYLALDLGSGAMERVDVSLDLGCPDCGVRTI